MPKKEVVTVRVVGIQGVSRPVSSEAKHGGIKLSYVVNVDTADVRAAAESSHRREIEWNRHRRLYYKFPGAIACQIEHCGLPRNHSALWRRNHRGESRGAPRFDPLISQAYFIRGASPSG